MRSQTCLDENVVIALIYGCQQSSELQSSKQQDCLGAISTLPGNGSRVNNRLSDHTCSCSMGREEGGGIRTMLAASGLYTATQLNLSWRLLLTQVWIIPHAILTENTRSTSPNDRGAVCERAGPAGFDLLLPCTP